MDRQDGGTPVRGSRGSCFGSCPQLMRGETSMFADGGRAKAGAERIRRQIRFETSHPAGDTDTDRGDGNRGGKDVVGREKENSESFGDPKDPEQGIKKTPDGKKSPAAGAKHLLLFSMACPSSVERFKPLANGVPPHDQNIEFAFWRRSMTPRLARKTVLMRSGGGGPENYDGGSGGKTYPLRRCNGSTDIRVGSGLDAKGDDSSDDDQLQ